MVSALLPLLLFSSFFFVLLLSANPNPRPNQENEFEDENGFSILTYHDYSPPSPPPSPPPFDFPASSCEDDLGGAGSFDTVCRLNSSRNLTGDVYIKGNGSLSIVAGVSLRCPIAGCFIAVNLSGSLQLGNGSSIVAGRVYIVVENITLAEGSAVDTTALAGDPPPQTSGSPVGIHGDGGGHGGRGASCFVKEGQTMEDSWGGDAYSWATLEKPDSYGSKGGTTNREVDFGGGGGGRIWMEVGDMIELDGVIRADGGSGGRNGGGGSGGSIYITASKM